MNPWPSTESRTMTRLGGPGAGPSEPLTGWATDWRAMASSLWADRREHPRRDDGGEPLTRPGESRSLR